MSSDKFQVKQADGEQYLTADLDTSTGTMTIGYAPAALAYSFTRAQAERLAAEHNGVVGKLTTVWGSDWKVTSRTWEPA